MPATTALAALAATTTTVAMSSPLGVGQVTGGVAEPAEMGRVRLIQIPLKIH
jgi:hypothetical protein